MAFSLSLVNRIATEIPLLLPGIFVLIFATAVTLTQRSSNKAKDKKCPGPGFYGFMANAVVGGVVYVGLAKVFAGLSNK